ncbi:hypothetical protein TOPH_04599 [Tolypocladium ophioglossoides CBS 100239]|uniref:Arca-like protein n=1 Tax=Tolypocladium ophioglossoides (strain CBS 100239) TaxID=1163406 RepID=A0A0L0N9F8_TOLOC|nr:hypothetical protein TOPH_04599 [Tolypocladium ophioglossoides CBS 100239]
MQFCFIDETLDVESLYGDGYDPGPGPSSKKAALQLPTSLPIHHGEASMSQHHGGGSLLQTTSCPTGDRLQSYRDLDQRKLSTIPLGSRLGLSETNDSPLDRAFPLHSWREAKLMKYYLEYMCNWFDLCDTTRHFAIHVPRKALSCPTLLNAIFALSSRHLSLKGQQFDQWISHQYHERCLQQLSRISNDSQALLNDDLLAATILLRTLEELEVPLLGTDNEGHLLGIQVFMNAHGSSATSSSLRQAAFWVGLRQEVTMAVASQRSIKISLTHNFIDQSFTHAGDDTWANRVILHCAKVVQFCFGESHHKPEEYRALVEYDKGWLHYRPSSFLPIAYMDPDASRGEVFPHILYLSHAVVIGVVHSILAQALLMCYDPTLPKIGPARKTSQEARENDIRQQVIHLCGTALSNDSTIPAMITASLGIATCGDRFKDDAERNALLGVLIKTEADHAWPTGNIQSSLKSAWGWD